MRFLLRLATKHWLRRYRKRKAVSVVRAVFIGDSIGSRIITDGVFAGAEIEALEREVFSELPSRKVALDIGANIGNHAVSFSNHFQNVIAFEPNPATFHVLQANAVGRPVTAVNKGLSDKSAELPFSVDFSNIGASRIVALDESSDLMIPVIRLDDFAVEHDVSGVTFVKIDVEGHEEEVFRGGAKFFAKFRPVVAFEGHYGTNPSQGQRIEELLRNLGYSSFRCVDVENQTLRDLNHRMPRLTKYVLRYVFSTQARKRLTFRPLQTLSGQNHDLILATA